MRIKFWKKVQMGMAMVSQMNTMPLLYFAMEVKNSLTLEDELPTGREVTISL
jgi:hypothetical protein